MNSIANEDIANLKYIINREYYLTMLKINLQFDTVELCSFIIPYCLESFNDGSIQYLLLILNALHV